MDLGQLAKLAPQERRRIEAQAQLQAVAELERRKRGGVWGGGIRPHVEYERRPLDWIVDKLGVPRETLVWDMQPEYVDHEWDGTRNPLVVVCDALADWRDVCVESATGTGKTYLAACLTYWFLACFEDSVVQTMAPKEDQLLLHIWRELGRLWPRFKAQFPSAEFLTGKIRMRPADADKESWAASAFVAGVGASEEIAQRAAGMHREHMLIITEETPGIDSAIMNAIQHTRTADHNLHLALGNPDHRSDSLHRFAFDESGRPYPNVVHVRISALDHPNVVTGRDVVPGAIGRRRLEERTLRYGKGSRLYQSRVRGICPAEAESALIRWEWCVAAAERYNDPAFREGGLALGLDVANSEHGSEAAIARWQGACLTEVEVFACPDASAFGKRIALEVLAEGKPDPRHIGIDSVGVGAAAVNKMRELGLRVRHISGGRRAVPGLDIDTLWSVTEPDLEGNMRPAGPVVVEAERFDNLRSQVWWRMREDLRLGRIALPRDEELWQDLTTPTFRTRGGAICVESKETIEQRLGRSPDRGDAACYGNWVRPRRPIRRTNAKELPLREPGRDLGLEHIMRAMHEEGRGVARLRRHMFRYASRR